MVTNTVQSTHMSPKLIAPYQYLVVTGACAYIVGSC